MLQVRDGDDQPGLQGDYRRPVHRVRGPLPRQGGTGGDPQQRQVSDRPRVQCLPGLGGCLSVMGLVSARTAIPPREQLRVSGGGSGSAEFVGEKYPLTKARREVTPALRGGGKSAPTESDVPATDSAHSVSRV